MDRIAVWRLGDNAMIQCVLFDGDGIEVYCEDMSGSQATEEIAKALQIGRVPVYDERGVYGYYEGNFRVEYWDCDECEFQQE